MIMHKKEEAYVYIFFILFFLICLYLLKDFGISIDEDNSRINGLVSLKYVLELFNLDKYFLFNSVNNLPSIHEYKEQGNGVIFDFPLALIETIFQIENERNIYLIRHTAVFIIFYISCIYLYKIIFERHKSYLLGVLAVIFLITSPRIFAESFYNAKDICFMSLCTIGLYYGISFLKKTNITSILKFTFFAALAIDTRILGIFLPFIFLLIYMINMIRSKTVNKKLITNIFLFLSSLFIFIIMFWPYLWSNPVSNFFLILKKLSIYSFPIKNFYMGSYIDALYVPWHYNLTWIFITTPLTYLIFFHLGFFFLIKRIFKRLIKIDSEISNNDLWRGENERFDLVILLCLIIPMFTVIILNSTLYTGWRHFYFVYPFIIIIAINGVKILHLFYIKNKIFLCLICFLAILPSLFWQYKHHPHQYVYFNYLLQNNFNKYFEMDYWGVSNYQTLIKLALNNKEKVSVKLIGDGDLVLTKKFLPNKYSNKIEISFDLKSADYLIDNFNRWNGKANLKDKAYIANNFKTFYELKINKNTINTIYKRSGF